MRAYEDFAWKLGGEYELEPSAETQAVVARIRAEPERVGWPRRATPMGSFSRSVTVTPMLTFG